MTDQEYLTDEERDLVFFIERFHAVTGVPPEETSMVDYLKSLNYSTTPVALQEILANSLFIKSMEARGIVLGPRVAKGVLTPRQMAAASTMANYVDRRSDGKKLQDLGISTAEYGTWLQDDNFVNYLQGRVERLLNNTTHEAHLGLIRGVRNGNVQAIKLHYELTGRYNPDKEKAVNLRVILSRVIEVIQKNVKDPEALASIGQELNQIAVEATVSQTIKGTAVARRE